MRDVEAHDRTGHTLQPELSLQLVNRITGALVRFLTRETCLLEKVPRILRRQIDQLTARPALRRVNLGAVE